MPGDRQPQRALVLSGGAVFGAYQAGAWQAVFESGWAPDFAAGISIGAVNAWLLSRGATVEEMREIWIDLPEKLLPASRDHVLPWKSQTPVFEAWLGETVPRFERRAPRFPMELVTVEIPRMRPRVIRGKEVGVEELRAAVFSPVELDGKLHMDIGPIRNIPREEALATGASDVLIIDLLHAHPIPQFRKIKKAAQRALARCGIGAAEPEPSPRERWVGHAKPLGGPIESFRWTRAFAERLWETGRRDAERVLGQAALRAS